MFWDRVAGVYDLFANFYNGKVHKELCKRVESMISPTDHVLECACGTGMLSISIAPKCSFLTATDFSQNMLNKAKQKCSMYSNIRFQRADICRLDYPDESFDKVIAANVIHLLSDPHQALKELDRVCKKGGLIIIPTYINKKNSTHMSVFSKTIEKAGADFKRQFTYASYRQFFDNSLYKAVNYSVINGRVPCAIAVIKKS